MVLRIVISEKLSVIFKLNSNLRYLESFLNMIKGVQAFGNTTNSELVIDNLTERPKYLARYLTIPALFEI